MSNSVSQVGSQCAFRSAYSSILNTRDDVCTSTLPGVCPSSHGEHKWYGGFALGYAF